MCNLGFLIQRALVLARLLLSCNVYVVIAICSGLCWPALCCTSSIRSRPGTQRSSLGISYIYSKTKLTELSIHGMQALEDPRIHQAVVAQTLAGLQSGHRPLEQGLQIVRDALSRARTMYQEAEECSRSFIVLGQAVPEVSASAQLVVCTCVSNHPVSSSAPVWCFRLHNTAVCTSQL